jgi:hypothetical protein
MAQKKVSGSFLKKRTKKLLLLWAAVVSNTPSWPRMRPSTTFLTFIFQSSKLSAQAGMVKPPPAQTNKSFLVLFFKKEPLS